MIAELLRQHVLANNSKAHNALLKLALTAIEQNNITDAISFMQKASEIAPEIALYKRNLGELLRRVGQVVSAIASHKKALHLEPDSAENHFLLGLAYNDNRQFESAIHHYRTAIAYDKKHGFAWNNLGVALENSGDKQTAKTAYTTAIDLNPQHAEAHNNLAVIYSEEGKLSEARFHFAAAIKANPDFVDAHYNLSLIKTYTEDDPHFIFLEAISKKINDCPIQTRIYYHFALGKALDDTKQYTRAFKSYAEGNRLHYLQQPWDKTNLQAFVKQMPSLFPQSFFKKTQTFETRSPIFIVGMPRSGTTLIEQILSSHDNIYGAGELSILDDIIQQACRAANLSLSSWIMQLTDRDFAVLGEHYLNRVWTLAPNKNFIIDKMPGNCFYIGLIYRMLPTAKIIHAMRDPMDSCFSCFTHLFKNDMNFAYDLTALGNYYQLYADVMQHWNAVLPPDSIFDVSYENMINDSENLSKQLIQTIGLPWDPNCLRFYENNRIVKTASLTQVRKPIYKTSLQRWRHFTNELLPLKCALNANPTQADALHLSGINAYQAGDISLAIKLIQEAIDNNPHVATFHSNLGEMHRQLNAIDLSIACGQRAVLLDHHSAIAWSNLGIAYYDTKNYIEAEKCHQRALTIDPTLSCSLNNMGSIYKAYDKIKQAIAFYQEAIGAAPHFIEPLNNVGMLLLDLDQMDAALPYFEKASQLNPDSATANYGIAKVYLSRHDLILSAEYINKAIAINPTLLTSLSLSKGSALMEMGKIVDAKAQFSKVVDDPIIDNRVLAHYSLIQFCKTKPNSTDLKALLSIANKIEEVSPDKREYIYFALGKCYDDMGAWKKAFAYFTQGCNLKRSRITYIIAEQIQLTDKILRSFTHETLDYLRGFANPSAMQIFIVGMPRSGTTLVEQILASHSNVHGAGELTYLIDLIQMHYPDNMLQLPSEILHAITDQYLFYLRQISADASYITDKMPQNFLALGLIHALFPNAKIIHVKRNPMDTCLSCYTKLFHQGQLYSYDLTELGQYYHCYERIMAHWRRILPSNAFFEIDYENIISHLEASAKELIAYCGLPWEEACLSFYESKRQVRTASFMQVREPIYTTSVNRWRRYEEALAPLTQILNHVL